MGGSQGKQCLCGNYACVLLSNLTASTCAGFHNPHDLQAQMETDLVEKTIKNTLACFEKMAANNAAPEGWLYGMKVKHNDAYGSYIYST